MRVVFFIAILMSAAAWANDGLQFKNMDGEAADLGQAKLIIFWSSDCAPCLREMAILPDIAKQNADLQLALISLKDAEHTRARLTPMPENVEVLVAQEDARTVLKNFGNDRTLALPYSVMLNKKSKVCGKYYGILSPDKVKQWRKTCL